MMVLEPDYKSILARFRQEQQRLQVWRTYIETAIKHDPVIWQNLKPVILKSRIKDESSLLEKVALKHDPPGRIITPHNLLHEIEDLAGVRLVLAQKNHVPIALDRIRNLPLVRVRDEVHYVWHPDEVAQVRREGYATQTKESGYCSRHLILSPPVDDFESEEFVTCEVQVRTLLEEAIFENDHRIRYKRKIGNATSKILTRLAELLETADQILADAYTTSKEERSQ